MYLIKMVYSIIYIYIHTHTHLRYIAIVIRSCISYLLLVFLVKQFAPIAALALLLLLVVKKALLAAPHSEPFRRQVAQAPCENGRSLGVRM